MKKLLKIVAWIAGILVGLIIVAVIALQIFLPKEKIRQMAEDKATEALGRQVTIADIDVSIWGGLGIKLNDFAVVSPDTVTDEPFLTTENVDAKLALLPLITGEYRVAKFIINKPRIVMVKTASGATNYSFETADSAMPAEAQEMPDEAKTAAAAVSFDRIVINGGEVVYRDDSTGMTANLYAMSLSTALDNPRDGMYQSKGEFEVDSLKFVYEEPYPTVKVALDYEAELDLDRKFLSLTDTKLEINDIALQLHADVDDPMGEPIARGNVQSDKLAVTNLFKLLPPSQQEELAKFDIEGDFALDIDLEYIGTRTENPFMYTGEAVITDMRMAREDIQGELEFSRALIDFKPDNVRMNIEDGMFAGQPLKGHLVVDNFDEPTINGALTGAVELAFVQPFLPPEQNHEISGLARFDVKISGRLDPEDLQAMSFTGTFNVDSGRYNAGFLPEPVTMFKVDAFFDKTLVNIRTFNSTFPSGYLNFSGRINNLVPYLLADSVQAQSITPSIDGQTSGQVDLGLANTFLPKKGDPEMSGQARFDLKFAGDAKDPSNFQPRGSLSVSNATYKDSLLPEDVTNFSFEARVSPDTIFIDTLDAEFESSDLHLAGKMADPFPFLLPLESIDKTEVEKPIFYFTLSSRKFNIDKLFPEAVPGGGDETATTPTDSISMVFLPDFDATGTFKADTIIYAQVDFVETNGSITYKERRIQVYDVTSSVYDGTVAGETTIDLQDSERPVYTGEFNASKIQMGRPVSQFTPFGGHLSGLGDLNGTYNAAGWDPETFMNSLTMNGRGAVVDGRIETSGAVYQLISGLAQKVGESFDRQQDIKNLATKIVVEDGRVRLDDFQMRIDRIGDLRIGGYYGFDGALSYDGALLLNKDLTKKLLPDDGGGLLGDIGELFTDTETERLALPLKIDGTLTNPNASFDFSVLTQNVSDNLQKKLKDLFPRRGGG